MRSRSIMQVERSERVDVTDVTVFAMPCQIAMREIFMEEIERQK